MNADLMFSTKASFRRFLIDSHFVKEQKQKHNKSGRKSKEKVHSKVEIQTLLDRKSVV